MKGSLILLLLCVFIAGVFFGIWMDYSAWHNMVGVQDIKYELEDNNFANLRMHPGDTFTLLSGGKATNPKINIVGGYPLCKTGTSPDTCIIDANSPTGSYHFTCSSDNGVGCPDPGLQQSGSPGGFQDFSYIGFVQTDFAHLVGMQNSFVKKAEPPNAAGAHLNANSITAWVACDGTTELLDSNNQSLQTIPASSGQSVFWTSPYPFTMNTTNFPAGLCTNGNPNGTITPQNGKNALAECDIQQNAAKLSPTYTVQAQITATCKNPINATLKVNQ